jgi:PAS domain S-box-containing protein
MGAGNSSLVPRRVLLVDRDRDLTDALRACLEANGFAVRVAYDVSEAFNAASESDARVVLLDSGLGGRGGMDLIRGLTERCPQTHCIMMADPGQRAEAVRTLRDGAWAWLRKPVDRDELLATVARSFETLQLAHDKATAEEGLARMKVERRLVRQGEDRLHETLPRIGQGYRHLMAYLPEVFYRTDREGTITMISPSVANVLGYPADAVVGKNMARDLYLERRHRNHLLEKLARTGTVNDEEVVLKHRDGHGVLVSVTARVARDADGRPNGVEGLFNDITRHRKIEDERTRLAAAVDQASELIFITDTDGIIQYVNPPFEKVTG